MTTGRQNPPAAVGTAQWFLNEHEYAKGLVDQQAEEFEFSTRNELEWLNEHMADIFSKTQLDLGKLFQTPGKLRGKTPRTARRRNLEERAPLTDIFGPTPRKIETPSRRSPQRQRTPFKVAEDTEEHQIVEQQTSRFSTGAGKENLDSGYGGSFQEAISVNNTANKPRTSPTKADGIPTHKFIPVVAEADKKETEADAPSSPFISADEDDADAKVTEAAQQETQRPLQREEEEEEKEVSVEPSGSPQKANVPDGLKSRHSQQYSVSVSTSAALDNALNTVEHDVEHVSPIQSDMDLDRDSTVSEESSPDRPMVRKKSSLTFASLPAREPLHTKSIGNRVSRTSQLGQNKTRLTEHETQPSLNARASKVAAVNDDTMDIDDSDSKAQDDAAQEATKLHSQTSTQRLHERITMLGKSAPARPSKSIHASTFSQQSSEPAKGLDPTKDQTKIPADAGEPKSEDGWISPVTREPSDEQATRTLAEKHAPSAQTQQEISVESRHADYKPVVPEKNSIISYPKLQSHAGDHATNIHGPTSPPKKEFEGPLSASKAKFYSVLKSARGIFASSAGTSAQAKLEALSSNTNLSKSLQNDAAKSAVDVSKTIVQHDEHTRPRTSDGMMPPPPPPKSTDEQPTKRSSARLEKKNQEKTDNREQQSKVTQPQASADQQPKELDHDRAPSQEPSNKQSSMQTSKVTGEARRPGKITKEQPAKAKPAPVSIRLASQRVGSQAVPAGASVHNSDNSAMSNTQRAPTLSKKASNSSISTVSSTQTWKTTATSSSARPKALEAAARKREQDEREAQRKLEQKREIEKRRAAKAEEERKAKEQAAAEQQRAMEAKMAAQKQAAEQRKAEVQRKHEQLRAEAAAAARNQLAEDFASSLQQEREQAPSIPPRADLGFSRAAQAANPQSMPRVVPHVNPAMPPKRQWAPQADEEERSARSPLRYNYVNGQNQAKRRKTEDEEVIEQPQRPTMAPPIRLSNMQKGMPYKFPNGYMSHAGASSQAASMFKSTVTAQHNMQHAPKTPGMNDLAQISNAKIPFANNPNPPQSSAAQQTVQRPGTAMKTPGTAGQKSSPQYPNGDSIELPDIATDSEDSEDENDFVPPDWANSPALRDLLQRQQLVDPMSVFGPIGPLIMDEVFKGNKERQAKFRARTSSANWNGPDRLTEEERRRDRLAREKLEREGGWTFNASL